MKSEDDVVMDSNQNIIGVIYKVSGGYEAWSRHRMRRGDIPGNVHKHLGVFPDNDQAMAAIATEPQWNIPDGTIQCPECGGAERDAEGDDCKLCGGFGYIHS